MLLARNWWGNLLCGSKSAQPAERQEKAGKGVVLPLSPRLILN
jgi:hypothetical protein